MVSVIMTSLRCSLLSLLFLDTSGGQLVPRERGVDEERVRHHGRTYYPTTSRMVWLLIETATEWYASSVRLGRIRIT